jgi:polar amino acid transport system substrate-binding protein
MSTELHDSEQASPNDPAPVDIDLGRRRRWLIPAAVAAVVVVAAGVVIAVTSRGPSGSTVAGSRFGTELQVAYESDSGSERAFLQYHGTFATIIPGVQNGRFDVGQDNFGVTKAREQVVDFATYLNDGQGFLASEAVPLQAVRDLTDLCGLTVATAPGSTFQQILTRSAATCAAAGRTPYTVQYFADSGPIYLGLVNAKVDVFFGPTLALRYAATHVPNTRFLSEISTTTVGFVTARGSPLSKPLSDAVNKLIATGDYARIFAKWRVSSSGIPTSQVNPPATL